MPLVGRKNELNATTRGTDDVSKVEPASEEAAWIYEAKEHKARTLRVCC